MSGVTAGWTVLSVGCMAGITVLSRSVLYRARPPWPG